MASRLAILLLSLFCTFTFSKHLLVKVEDGEGLEDEGGNPESDADGDSDVMPELDDKDPSAADDKVANRQSFFTGLIRTEQMDTPSQVLRLT